MCLLMILFFFHAFTHCWLMCADLFFTDIYVRFLLQFVLISCGWIYESSTLSKILIRFVLDWPSEDKHRIFVCIFRWNFFFSNKKKRNNWLSLEDQCKKNTTIEKKLIEFPNEFQYVTEKMGGAEGTKLDLDFMDMERVSEFIRISL